VTGRIVDGKGAPIPGSRVGRGDHGFFMFLSTDDAGRFKLDGFAESAQTITFAAKNYKERKLTIAPGVTELGDVALEPEGDGDAK
jgi:hypothetical protein